MIGMVNWVVCLGRLDISLATSSLSSLTACPREGHRDRVLRIFGYLKKCRNRRIDIDSQNPILVGEKKALDLNFPTLFTAQYPDAAEEIDVKIPNYKVDEL